MLRADEQHFTAAERFVKSYLEGNPKASVTEVCKAANNRHLTVPHEFVAGIRRAMAAAPFNPPKVVVPTPRPAVALAPPPPPAEPPPPPPADPQPKKEPKKKVAPRPRKQMLVGTPRKILTIAQLNGEKAGSVVVVMECGHARVMVRSAIRKRALCTTCHGKDEQRIERPLRKLVAKYGKDKVVDVLARLELEGA